MPELQLGGLCLAIKSLKCIERATSPALFTKYGCDHPQIKAERQHFNLIVQIQYRGKRKAIFQTAYGCLTVDHQFVNVTQFGICQLWIDKTRVCFSVNVISFLKAHGELRVCNHSFKPITTQVISLISPPSVIKGVVISEITSYDISPASCCSPGRQCFTVGTQLAVLIKNILLLTHKLLHFDQTNTLHLIVLLLFLCLFLLANTDTESSVLSIKPMLTEQISRLFFFLFLWSRLRLTCWPRFLVC